MGFLIRSSHSFHEEFVTNVCCSLYHKANWQHLQDGPEQRIEFRPILRGSTARYKTWLSPSFETGEEIRNDGFGERALGKSTAIVRLTQTDTHTREEGEDH